MRIQQLIAFLMISVMAPFVMAQDYTPSAEVTAAIVAAQADGNVTDAEAAALAQAIAADGGNATAVATTLSASAGASAVQVAAGLAAVGQTQNQIANTLVATNVATQAQAQTTAQAGRTAAINSGAAVATRAQVATAASAATLAVSSAGLITDSSGKAVVVRNAGDQVLLIKAIIQGNQNNGGATNTSSNANLVNALNTALRESGSTVTVGSGANSSLDDLLDAADDAVAAVEEATGADLDGDGGVGVSPGTVS